MTTEHKPPTEAEVKAMLALTFRRVPPYVANILDVRSLAEDWLQRYKTMMELQRLLAEMRVLAEQLVSQLSEDKKEALARMIVASQTLMGK